MFACERVATLYRGLAMFLRGEAARRRGGAFAGPPRCTGVS